MTAAPFGTLKLSRQLRERARFDQDQAEGLAEALAEAFQEQIATRADILLLQNEMKLLRQDLQNEMQVLRQDMKLLEQRLTIKMGGMIAAAIGILLALEKLIK
jgi:hypothetical protein